MSIFFSQLKGIKVSANNISLGRIYDFYFDDKTEKIKDVVVKKGFGNKIDEHFFQINKIDKLENKKLILKTKEEDDKRTPILHTDYVMSKYFGWPNVWSISEDVVDENGLLESSEHTPNLRSMLEVNGYRLKSDDKYQGYICDFLIDNDSWEIISFVIDANKFFPSRNKQNISVQKINLELKYPEAIII
jgi:sporulation protein YlmC with PRC-barrel domain